VSDDDYEAGDVNTIAADEIDDDLDDEEEDEEVEEEIDYEDGDVNALGESLADDRDDMAGNRSEDSVPVTVLTYIARSLADEPDSVVVEAEDRRGSVVLRVHVAPEDMGRVIGRRGRTAQAIRTLVGAAGARDGTQVSVDIVDD
jgi:predicted RNA-binding protein YlqC (UPF0109 family)